MMKNRTLIYLLVGLLFVAIWAGALAFTTRANRDVANEVFDQVLDAALLRIEEDAQRRIDDAGRGAFAPMSSAPPGESESTSCAVDEQGRIYLDGEIVGSLPADAVAQAHDGGGAMACIQSWRGGEAAIASVAAAPGSGQLLSASVEPMEGFARRLGRLLDIPCTYAALYDEGGAPVMVLSQEDAPQSTREAVQHAVTRALGGESLSVQSGAGELIYNVVVPLPMLKGWSVGLRASAADYVPLQANVISAYIMVLLAFLAVFAHFVYRDISLSRGALAGTSTDPLTGLWSSAAFESIVTAHFEKASTQNWDFICLDVVAFHRFNTVFDHAAGDRLLRVIGGYIAETCAFGMRVNGDLFACVTRAEEGIVQKMNQGLHAAIRKEMGEAYQQVVSFKFGIYPLMEEELHYLDAYDGAMLALKQAKGQQDLTGVSYDFRMKKEAEMQKFIEMHMFQALEDGEFLVYIQPKFTVRDIRCSGGEALVRWHSEQLGFLAPYQFIPLFEQTGFIAEVDFYILTRVLRTMRALMEEGKELLPIAVNQSRVTISFPNYLSRLDDLVRDCGVPLHLIELEITESVLSEDPARMVELVEAIREMGMTVAMDDFGSGYSSLNTLRALPVDILKIDKGFLKEADTSEKGRRIIGSVIEMARDLRIGTVCEGVETGGQLDFLRASGCDIAQGYFLAKPMPAEEYIKQYLAKSSIA